MQFVKATKRRAKLRLALIGPSGSGKTWTGLMLACQLGQRVAVIDTERGSASKYSDLYSFDVLELDSFHPKTYVEAIRAAAGAGYDALLIDSLSHAWAGKDGALEMVDKVSARSQSRNNFAAWREVTPHHNALVEAILQAPLHVVGTMRTKTEYVVEKDERTGKTAPRKIGLQPVQRDGLEYEFDVVADIDLDNTLLVSKTRCPALSGAVVRKPDVELAKTLRQWLDDGVEPLPGPPAARAHDIPADGAELQRRLQEYDAKLARQGLCRPGDLLRAVVAAGVQAGHPADLPTWSVAAIQLAVVEAKAFAARMRQQGDGPGEPPPPPPGEPPPRRPNDPGPGASPAPAEPVPATIDPAPPTNGHVPGPASWARRIDAELDRTGIPFETAALACGFQGCNIEHLNATECEGVIRWLTQLAGKDNLKFATSRQCEAIKKLMVTLRWREADTLRWIGDLVGMEIQALEQLYFLQADLVAGVMEKKLAAPRKAAVG